MSCVKSTGKPYVSYKRHATSPGTTLEDSSFAIVRFNKFRPRDNVFKNCVSSSLIVSIIL